MIDVSWHSRRWGPEKNRVKTFFEKCKLFVIDVLEHVWGYSECAYEESAGKCADSGTYQVLINV